MHDSENLHYLSVFDAISPKPEKNNVFSLKIRIRYRITPKIMKAQNLSADQTISIREKTVHKNILTWKRHRLTTDYINKFFSIVKYT